MLRTLLLILIGSVLLGCTTHFKGIPKVSLGPMRVENLTEADYEVIGDVTGSASGGRILIFNYGADHGAFYPNSSFGPQGSPTLLWILGGPIGSIVFVVKSILRATTSYSVDGYPAGEAWHNGYSAALYDALERAPDADAMLLPSASVHRSNWVLWENWQANVRGTAVRIKTSGTP